MSKQPLVTVVSPTTCDPSVLRAIQSVPDQSYNVIQHLVVIDNPDAPVEIKAAIRQYKVDVIELPYATGKDRFVGHRIIGASTFLGKGDFFCFLDEDNWFDTNHVASLFDVIRSGFTWAFSFRKIVDREGNFICNSFASGRARLFTSLLPIGSGMRAKTTGIVFVVWSRFCRSRLCSGVLRSYVHGGPTVHNSNSPGW